ncbi:hypothetical protein FGE12_26100 [Aggregicoccus sp. 17bor-14]|uniref:hypothetical protein n=1 Tax=Myxococcaceae TaxID=31 RepID=UPI00129C987D|nr:MULTISPECIES: hypothetical protein [Myxococcaceae]MBF5045910.1 hypothetical protein [Simulacricoccus sp. 17bor-14]MRI91644.1 hypothetical protein [Aggregicoccus sp. 17bor-14]
MRPCLLAAALVALLAAPAAFAVDVNKDLSKSAKAEGGRCHITLEPGDVLVERKDLVLQPGQTVHDAVALEGNVVVKKGAVVKSVVAFHGTVTVEEGAEVLGDVVSLGGELRLQPGARVGGNALALGGKMKRADTASVKGDQLSLGGLELNGVDLVGGLLTKVLGDLKDCRVELEGAEASAK